MVVRPGPVALFGSGETSSQGRKVYDWLFHSLSPRPVRVAILETPAGFQPNSELVAGKVGGFLRDRLRNFHPQVTLIPARRRGAPFGTDDPALLDPMLQADAIFLGPGSPTYAVRHLQASLAWGYLQARHRLGAALILASAATIAAGRLALPVYEIYKVGDDPYWCPGLDLFGAYGLSLVFVPHWDNSEGGAELDTSRCFMGRERFERLMELLPEDTTLVGIDEHTALVIDPSSAQCRVMGRGGVTLTRDGEESRYLQGATFDMGRLGPYSLPEAQTGLPAEVWEAARAGQKLAEDGHRPPEDVLRLVGAREEARAGHEWSRADELRARIAELGWQVQDTPDGPRLELLREIE